LFGPAVLALNSSDKASHLDLERDIAEEGQEGQRCHMAKKPLLFLILITFYIFQGYFLTLAKTVIYPFAISICHP
jgi:hypothetical protein